MRHSAARRQRDAARGPGLAAGALRATGLLAALALAPVAQAAVLGPELQPRAFWVDSSVCTVLVKAPIDVARPLQAGTPIDLLATMPAICTSSVTGQAPVPGGVRSLLVAGFRITAVSHTVSALPVAASAAGAPAEGRVELLISAIFALERPQAATTSGR